MNTATRVFARTDAAADTSAHTPNGSVLASTKVNGAGSVASSGASAGHARHEPLGHVRHEHSWKY